MVKVDGEIITVAYCVLRSGGKIVFPPKAYAVAAPI
jgi:hypothetical protein